EIIGQEILLSALKEKGKIKEIKPDKTFSKPQQVKMPSSLKENVINLLTFFRFRVYSPLFRQNPYKIILLLLNTILSPKFSIVDSS
ncbi:hypothetical protein ACTPEM_22750, partial [Clostridioides difficile]